MACVNLCISCVCLFVWLFFLFDAFVWLLHLFVSWVCCLIRLLASNIHRDNISGISIILTQHWLYILPSCREWDIWDIHNFDICDIHNFDTTLYILPSCRERRGDLRPNKNHTPACCSNFLQVEHCYNNNNHVENYSSIRIITLKIILDNNNQVENHSSITINTLKIILV